LQTVDFDSYLLNNIYSIINIEVWDE